MFVNSSGQYIKIGYSLAQCTKLGSGLTFLTVRVFEENFFPTPPTVQLIFTTWTKNDAFG